MSNILFSYINAWAAGTVTASSEHPNFPAINTQHRWFKKPWRSKYGAGSNWGLFRITAANCKVYFTEGGGALTATLTTGDYDATTLCAQIKTALQAAGADTYTITYSDITNKFTLTKSAGTFNLTCTNNTNAAWGTIGFSIAIDRTGALTYVGDYVRIHTSEFIYCDLGATTTIREVILKGHNLQATATITCHYYSDAFITLVDSESIVWHADQVGVRTAKSYHYMAIEISDRDNPATYIENGLIWVGNTFLPHYGYNPERTLEHSDPSIQSESEDGQASTIQLSHYDQWEYIFEAVLPANNSIYKAMFAEVGKTRPCFIVENPPSLGDIGPLALYVTLITWQYPHIVGDFWGLSLEVKTER